MPTTGPFKRPKRAYKKVDRQLRSWRSLAQVVGGAVAADKATERADREIARMARGSEPIVVGPWLSEIGPELQYWIPMLQRFASHYGVDPGRMVAVSRGGVEAWYRNVCGTYVEAFDVVSPEELRRHYDDMKARGMGEKVWEVSDFDRRILEHARRQIGAERVNLIHPSLMNRRFRDFWVRTRKPGGLAKRMESRPLERSADPALTDRLSGLPEDYVAVKAYFSHCFPDTPENRSFVRDLVGGLAETGNVVVLSTGLDVDDHAEYSPEAAGNVYDAQALMRPADNLGVQTDIIRRARALFTTYGGFAYLGPFLGIDTLAFYSLYNFKPNNLDQMRAVNEELGAARFTTVKVDELELLDLLARARRAPAAA